MNDLDALIRQRDELDAQIQKARAEEGEDKPTVSVSARYLLDHLAWDRACDMLGLNKWIVNEGQMDSSERLTFTIEQAQELGLIPRTDRRGER